ncbi:MAG: hypothetical protein GY696_18175, partial [Gammaproteobacteria bacterium]|nr:hypothetical protein [Gammaproteobacteria bacterium]
MSLPFVTRHGLFFVGLIDSPNFDFLTPMVIVLELVAVGYIYGIKNFVEDVTLMLG